MDRSNWDKIVSGAGAVVAVVLIALGAMAIYGGNFGQQNVRDRLEPQNISFPPAEAMSPEEKAEIGEFAGQKVDTGVEAEAFSRYIGGHLEAVNDGKTYSETSSEARAEGLDPDTAAELQGKADTLFKGETLRADPAERLRLVDGRDDRPVGRHRDGDRGAVARDPLDPRVPARWQGVGDHEGAPGQRPGVRRRNTLERAASAPGRFTGGARLQAGSSFSSVGRHSLDPQRLQSPRN